MVDQFQKHAGKWLPVLIVASLGVAGLGIFMALRPPERSSTATPSPSPTVASATKTIAALGRLQPQGDVIKLAAPSAMGTTRVTRLLVKEGQPVQPNQVIAILDSGNTRYAEALQAQAQLQEARSRLAQVQAGAKPGDIAAQQAEARRLAAELQNAQREYQRYENLYRQGAISAADLDARRVRVETTAQSVEQARQQLKSVAEVRPTDIRQAEAQVQVAAANLQRAKTELDNSVVRSPIEGTVLKIHAYPGEQVGQNGIVELGRTQQMYVVAEVYETDVPRVRRGQRATISSPTLPNKLTGTVETVGLQVRKNDVLNNDPAADVDARVVEVKIRLEDSKAVAGLTNLQVQVEIEP